jgi:hypothetical protein
VNCIYDRHDAQGTTRMQTITNWRDVVTLISVKQEISIAYSGTIPTAGYPVSRQILLQSASQRLASVQSWRPL